MNTVVDTDERTKTKFYYRESKHVTNEKTEVNDLTPRTRTHGPPVHIGMAVTWQELQ
jgi:hypothetical protein